MNVDGSMNAPHGDDADLSGMLAFDSDNFMDTDDLVGGLLPLDVDLNQHLDDAAAGSSSFQNNLQSLQGENPAEGMDMMDSDGVMLSGPGAGPLPASYGVQLPPNVGSTLTEFTKRRNWSQRIIEEIKDFLHVLTPDGRIIYSSPSTHALTGHDPHALVGQFISDFIHPDDNAMFVREFNESIASGNPLRFFYRFRRPDSSYAIFESHGHPHIASDTGAYGSSNAGAPLCRGFFLMARPYPTKNAGLLDSFLEHKVENERLKKRIADLKREEQEDLEEQQRQWTMRQMDTSSPAAQHVPADLNNVRSSSGQSHSDSSQSMPPPAKPGPSNLALTRQNLNDALAASRPDSINDKMARYEGVSHLETIEMLTGLRYRDGERSKGISTGAESPSLVKGDQGIAISVDRDRLGRSFSGSPYGDLSSDRDKKKKMKVADEYVCTDCGTLDSPEWRKGPTGPKTLCNACGLRWAKKEKKKSVELQPDQTSAKHHGGNGAGMASHVPPNVQSNMSSTSATPTQSMVSPPGPSGMAIGQPPQLLPQLSSAALSSAASMSPMQSLNSIRRPS